MSLSSKWREWKDRAQWHRQVMQDKWETLPTSRRTLIIAALLAVTIATPVITASVVLRREGRASRPPRRVVLYTSIDEDVYRPIVEAFTAKTDIQVRVVGDTEATKATGLVQRLIAEKDAPVADVWWSGEPLSTMILAKNGVLRKYASVAEAEFRSSGWPEGLRAQDGTWYGLALRSRVIAYNTNRVQKGDVPTALRMLAEPKWAGKVGMARPQFGTTRLHMAALVASNGEEAFREWLENMERNGLRLYDGNSSVVRALSVGEIELGLTDTDDVHAGLRNHWPVDMVFEKPDASRASVSGLRSAGPIEIPCTVGLVKGGPNPTEANRLVDYLIGAEAERMLAVGDAKHWPIRPALQREFSGQELPKAAGIEWGALLDASDRAGAIVARVLGSK